ncbi:MAG: hypothetical protein ACF8AM_06635, partial [Rhodopirellula sp. JB055]|uniref:hypothetical protein n=1 Tax=Rhodopirellula sp. JB055 TaxID=3342846 RepID=UPI00370AD8E7
NIIRHGVSVGIERVNDNFFLSLKAVGKLTGDTNNSGHSGDPMRLRDLASLRQKRIDTRRHSNSSPAVHLPHPNPCESGYRML